MVMQIDTSSVIVLFDERNTAISDIYVNTEVIKYI
jgi:hypothetical protein